MVDKQLDKYVETLAAESGAISSGADSAANDSDGRREAGMALADAGQVNPADAIKFGGGSFR